MIRIKNHNYSLIYVLSFFLSSYRFFVFNTMKKYNIQIINEDKNEKEAGDEDTLTSYGFLWSFIIWS